MCSLVGGVIAAVALVYDELGVQLHQGDCLTVLAGLPDGSVDSVVTDPPAGIAFMGRSWDGDRGGRDQWIGWLTERMVQAHRVLKPGGYALVWALPRTSHWTAVALDDAGFEIRDCVTHLFGSGFPKSLDVSKAIDRAAGAEREVIGTEPDRWTNKGTVLNFATDRPQSAVPVHGPAVTDGAQRWAGWGTALKPASEHWWLVRKPFAGTVAANVLAHGTGALNIDACRVAATGRPKREVADLRAGVEYAGTALAGRVDGSLRSSSAVGVTDLGRWPPNVVFTHTVLLDPATGEPLGDACADGCVDGCPVAELNHQSGTLSNCGGPKLTTHDSGMFGIGQPGQIYSDVGGASRFFPCFRYQAKAPSSERPKVDGKSHPTVKALGLMRWLVRLVTPPGGVVLDPFAGTGATGQAARAEGFRCVLVDSDPQSIEWTVSRLAA